MYSQVLPGTWSVIIAICQEGSFVVMTPFEGMQTPPHHGEPCIDSRDLWYDPRGWWRHAAAVTTSPSARPGRLYRLPRGLSASGLPWGAGSLNEPLREAPGMEGGGFGPEGGVWVPSLSGYTCGELRKAGRGRGGGDVFLLASNACGRGFSLYLDRAVR